MSDGTPSLPKLAGKMGENGHDVKKLASVLNVSVDTARRILRGERQLDLNELYKLMNFYNCSFSDIFAVTRTELKSTG